MAAKPETVGISLRGARTAGIVATIVGAAWLGFVPVAGAGAVPQLVNYEGSLTNASGQSVADGSYGVTFSIYAAATGGTPIWAETWSGAGAVVLTGGSFNVLLGSKTAIPAWLFEKNPTTYLGVNVGADAEMLPRQRISSTPYALASYDGVPRGLISLWSGSVASIPAGWALCDGVQRTAPDGTLVTPPDLRSRFVVGAGSTYAPAAAGGEASHTLTAAEMPSHTHGVTDPGHVHGFTADNDMDTPWPYSATGNNPDGTVNTNSAFTGISIQGAGSGQAHNNLPPYYALAYIMKL